MSEKKKVLILSTEFGTEQDELKQPAEKLAALGHDVTIATPEGGSIQTMKMDKEMGDTVPADKRIADVSGDFDVVLLPGGTINADQGRAEDGIKQLVTKQASAGRTIAAICHAPWILVEAGLAEGKTMTSVENIRTDLKNAGASVKDESVVVCDAKGWKLITSRTPKDLDDFIKAIDEA